MDEKDESKKTEKMSLKEDTPVNSKDRLVPRLIEDEMKQSYLDYSMSVIVGRALPDVRDGLKPVHRRVIYTMWETGLLHNKPFKKSANVVGNCMARYHPHGDSAIYDTLVRLAQDFSLRHPLVNGQGNFGSIDGDNAAAMRYTEARLKKLAEEILQDIDKETVDFQPNFDGSLKEPSVLPSKVPNLLINGSSGIAVGMATNIPPHNLSEVVDGVVKVIENPEIETLELMKYIKGPDFPTGGIIYGTNVLKMAYEYGRGKVKVRAKTHIEEHKSKDFLIVDEIPYMVNKSHLIQQIADCVKTKKIVGISDLRDESDRDGMRIVIELKKDADSDVIINQLFKHTRMQETFGINMLALVNNVPKVMGLKAIVQNFISHRQEVVRRRTQFELKKAEDRAHILEGLLIALSDIDKTIKIVKKSKSPEEARNALMSAFKLSEKQAQAILDMRLQRLTSMEQDKIKAEHENLIKLIAELKSILASEEKILDIIKKELQELKENYADERRTELVEGGDELDIDIEDLIEDDEMIVTITHSGYIKRLSIDTYRQQRRGGKGIRATETKEGDFLEHLFVARNRSYILFFTDKGRVHWLKVYKIPESGRYSKGKAIVNMLDITQEEKITAFIPVREFDEDHFLILATKKGIVKKTNIMAYSRPRRGGIIAINLDDGDNLINAKLTDGEQQIILATKNGMAVKFSEKDARSIGRTSHGVIGIRLKGKDEVIGMVIADDNQTLLTITKNGFGKRTKISEYRLINRGGTGVINIQCSERNGDVTAVKSVDNTNELMLISKKGIIIRTSAQDISTIGRNTQGVRLMRLNTDDAVVAAAKIVTPEEEEKVEEEKVELAKKSMEIESDNIVTESENENGDESKLKHEDDPEYDF